MTSDRDFREIYAVLCGLYCASAALRSQVRQYHSVIGRHQKELVRESAKKMLSRFKRFPTPREWNDYILELGGAPRKYAKPARPEPSHLEPDNPFEKFAKAMEQESLDLGLDPEAPTPREIAQRRFAHLNKLLDRHLSI